MTVNPMDHPRRCHATNRQGRRCGRICRDGHSVCHYHGGASPQALAAAKVRLAEREARRLADLFQARPITDVFAALSELAGEVVLLKDIMLAKVVELEGRPIVDRVGAMHVHGLVSAYERSLDRAASVLVAIGKLDLDERRVRVTEQQVHLLGIALEAVMHEVGIAPDTWQPIAARHLRALQAGEL